MRIGAVNWDCSLPPNTFFGSYFSKTLSAQKWRYRTPFYADILSEDRICCHYRTPEEFDRELAYAIEAKIDYFAYVWHTDDKNAAQNAGAAASVTLPHAWTQDYARKLHQKSLLAEKIKLCAILLCGHPYTQNDYGKLAEAMNAPYYETVGDRPMVYLFGGYRTDVIDTLRSFPKRYGTRDPYIVMINNGVTSEDGDYSKADAVSGYGCEGTDDMDRYEQLIDVLLQQNEDRKSCHIDTIPLFTVGWDPAPRIETTVPWFSYPKRKYAKTPTPHEIEAGAKRLAAWICENREYAKVGHILTFAWNEFEEGAYICPTYNEDGSINTERISAFTNAVTMFNSI